MFYHNYVNLCNERGISPSAAAEEMGFHRSDVTRWSKGAQPRQATVQKIAEYFGVPISELVSDSEEAKKESPSQSGELNADQIRKLLEKMPTPEIINLISEATEMLKKRG